ncbi:MAG: serine/threonine protein kinase [Polyangiaceae bacterium]|nr:serine/threonine protein kinase [Polyangiaceae bacterium]
MRRLLGIAVPDRLSSWQTMPQSANALIGQLVDDRYRILRLIGRGGMGAVYEAEAVRLGRRCAFKVLLPEYTKSETAIQRFRREAHVAARVKNPHVVEVFDTGTTSDGQGYIAMELLRGESLERTLHREGRLPWPRVRHIALQICRALGAAHAQGVVHRDMKPENCFRISQNRDPDFIKVLDFGIAKLTDAEGEDAVKLTATNSVIGTYAYMAFEQVAGQECDHRVDIWAVGVIIYELLTGTLPFHGSNQGQLWASIFQKPPIPLEVAAPGLRVPRLVEALIARALEKSRDARYPTIDELAVALSSIDDAGEPIKISADGLSRTLPPTAPTTSQVDVQAPTAAASVPIAFERTRLASTPAPVDFDRGGVDPRGATDAIGSIAATSTTDPLNRTELAPMESVVTELHRPLRRKARAEIAAHRASSLWIWLLGGVSLALVSVVSVLALSRPVPTMLLDSVIARDRGIRERIRTTVPLPIHEPSTPEPPAEAPPPAPVDIVIDDDPPPETTAAKPLVSSKKKRETTRTVDYKAKIEADVAKRCTSLRSCFSSSTGKSSMTVKFLVTAATGRVQAAFPPLAKNSAVTTCMERKIRDWRFPTGGAGDTNVSTLCTIKPL